jgi:hypothetical protein
MNELYQSRSPEKFAEFLKGLPCGTWFLVRKDKDGRLTARTRITLEQLAKKERGK